MPPHPDEVPTPDNNRAATHDDGTAGAVVPTTFVLEVVERANDRLLDRIDSLDAFFGVLMTAALAVILLTLDRFRLIGFYPDVDCGWVSMVLLTLAFLAAVVGWSNGNDTLLRKLVGFGDGRESELDAPIPERFAWAVGKKGEEALIDTIKMIERAFKKSYPIRTFKRNMASLALALLVGGTLFAVTTKVVYLIGNDTKRQSGAAEAGTRDRGGRPHSGRQGR